MDPLFRIIKNDTILFSDYSEEVFFKRDEEEKLISELKPIAEKRRCENIFLHGPTGSGKTPLIRSVLNTIKSYNRSVICLYINCWHYSTSMAIYVKIADALGEPVSRRGRATDEIFDRILERMRNENMGVLLALDDIDGLICHNDTKILYNLARVADNCARFGVIGISQDRNIINRLDQRILDSLRFSRIEIKGYSREQLLALLETRADVGLTAGSYEKEILERIADIGVENNGNCRLILEILRRSAKVAERKGKQRITLEDVEQASYWLRPKSCIINQEEQIVIDILKTGARTTSELYWLFCKELMRSRRQIRNYLQSLEMKGIVESRVVENSHTFGSKTIRLTEG